MSNNKALSHANHAAGKANQAKGMLLTDEGAIDPETGAGGFGLQYLAEAIEALSLAVAFLAQQQA